ncbi:MAG: DUF4132 domain-containing protein, partial [Rhodospirillaceae bacterium]|nr:DUF4132 domain-containing protein [Rhodospirillaceae bacterium]
MFGFGRRRDSRLEELLTKPLDLALRDTGSPLLDAFLDDPLPHDGLPRGPFRDSCPSAALIDDAKPSVRGDIIARSFVLHSRMAAAESSSETVEWRKVAQILYEFQRSPRASLGSADAAVLLGTDVEGFFEIPAFRRPATFLLEIMSMVKAARELRPHANYVRYLTDMADYIESLPNTSALSRMRAIPLLIEICRIIGRPTHRSQFLMDARDARAEAASIADELRIEAGPILGPYVATLVISSFVAPRAESPSFAATKKAVLDASPELRNAAVLAILRVDRLSRTIRRDIHVNSNRPGGRYYGRAFSPLFALSLEMFQRVPWKYLLADIVKQKTIFTEDEAAELIELHVDDAAMGCAPPIDLTLFKRIAASVSADMPRVLAAVQQMRAAPSQIRANYRKALQILEKAVSPKTAAEAVVPPPPWEVLKKVAAARDAVIAAEQSRREAADHMGPLEVYPHKPDNMQEVMVIPYNNPNGNLANYVLTIWRALRAGIVPDDDIQFLHRIVDCRTEFARSRRQALDGLKDPGPGAIFTNPQAAAEYSHLRISMELAERFTDRTAYFVDRLAFYERLPSRDRTVLGRLETFAVSTVKGTRPSARWRKQARGIVGNDAATAMTAAIAMLNAYRPYEPKSTLGWALTHQELEDADQLPIIGLVWMAADWPAATVAKPLTDLALRCFVSVPGHGMKFERLGNACLWALSNLDDGAGAVWLSRIAARVRYPKVKAKIDAALNKAAEDAHLSRADLDELIVPTHGFDERNVAGIAVGDGAAVIAFDGPKRLALSWRNGDGKTAKSPSKAMREADPDAVKVARALVKEATADLGDQLRRIERGYLTDRCLAADDWRVRYVEHVFIGPACRSLIWRADLACGGSTAGLWRNGRFETVTGVPVDVAGARMSLWHPLHGDPSAALAWRDRLEVLEIVQPFKQAWREVYAPTDAERLTGTYSNRFAGHILRQHQAMALAQMHGWKCQHRFGADTPNDYPTHIA